MFSLEIAANFKKYTSKTGGRNRMAEDLTGVLAVPVYIGVPTMLGLTGWEGMAAGVGAAVIIGIALDIPGMVPAALGIGAAHATYAYFTDDIEEQTGKPIFNFPADIEQQGGGTNDYYYGQQLSGWQPSQYEYGMQGLANGNQVITLPDGQQVYARAPTDMAAATAGVSDYYMASQPMMLEDGDLSEEGAYGQ